MKKWLMISLLALGVVVPSVAHAATAAGTDGESLFCCPCCGG